MKKLDTHYIQIEKTEGEGEGEGEFRFFLIPDSYLKSIVCSHEPKYEYEKIPNSVKKLVLSNKSIPLNTNNCFIINGKFYVDDVEGN